MSAVATHVLMLDNMHIKIKRSIYAWATFSLYFIGWGFAIENLYATFAAASLSLAYIFVTKAKDCTDKISEMEQRMKDCPMFMSKDDHMEIGEAAEFYDLEVTLRTRPIKGDVLSYDDSTPSVKTYFHSCGGSKKLYVAKVRIPVGESGEVEIDPDKLGIMECPGCKDCECDGDGRFENCIICQQQFNTTDEEVDVENSLCATGKCQERFHIGTP